MDIAKSFSYVFEDEAWISKVLIGGLIFLLPVIGQITVAGYSYKVAQNVARGVERPLPDWGEFGEALVRGFLGWLISLVYALPAALISGILVLVSVGTAAAADEARRGAGVAFAGAILCLVPLIVVLSLICVVAALAAVARYLATDDIGQAFKFGEVFASLRSSIGAWVLLLVLTILAGFVGGLGLIACGVGALFTSFYAQCVIGHGLGQTIRQLGLGQPAAPPAGYGPPPPYSA